MSRFNCQLVETTFIAEFLFGQPIKNDLLHYYSALMTILVADWRVECIYYFTSDEEFYYLRQKKPRMVTALIDHFTRYNPATVCYPHEHEPFFV